MTWNDMSKRWYEDYERGRPGYPATAVRAVGVPMTATVVDLGAGTGKLTRLLISTFDRVVAVEPDDEMRRLLVELCPAAETLPGRGEDIPLPDNCADAVFAAQSFHWFAHAQALAEIARVLRRHGQLVLMWNVPTGEIEPSVSAAKRLLEPHWPQGWELPLDLGKHSSGDWRLAFAGSNFDELEEVRLPNPQTVDHDELIAFFESMGWIAGLRDEDRIPLLDEVRSQLTARAYRLPWETHVYSTRLKQ